MTGLEKEITEFGVKMFESFGLDTLTAKLVTVLYFSPKEVSMEELSKKTGYSLSSVSNKMRVLENVFVERIKKPGTKKVYYYMEKNLIKINQRKIKAAYENTINPVKRFAPNVLKKYGSKKLSEEDKQRLDILAAYHQQVLKFEKMLEQLEECLKREVEKQG